MSRIAVFPGSFVPFTVGHEAIVRKAIPLFDKIIVAIGQNSTKTSYFTLESRIAQLEGLFKSESSVSISSFEGLTIDFCAKAKAKHIIRGLRSARDFEYESSIAHMNHDLDSEIETVFLLCDASMSAINSSIVREIHKNGGDVAKFLPSNLKLLQTK